MKNKRIDAQQRKNNGDKLDKVCECMIAPYEENYQFAFIAHLINIHANDTLKFDNILILHYFSIMPT